MTQAEPQDINTYLANEWLKQGVEYSNLGNYRAALTSFEKAVALNPNNPEALCKQGVVLAYLGCYEDAITGYDKALLIKPDDHTVWFCRGLALFNIDCDEEAIDSFDRAIKIKTDHQEYWYSRGNALKELGRSKEAIASYDKALQIQPDFHEAWNDRGNALTILERYEEAIDSYDKALQIQPSKDQSWSNQGVALHKLGRDEEAIPCFDKALKIRPDNPQAWSNRGNALEHLGRHKEAIDSCDRALKIKPDFQEAWNNRGNALGNIGQYEEAINSYDRALQIRFDSWEAWIGRGSAVGLSVHSDSQLTAFSSLDQNNPALKQRGYEGALANYEEGLRYVHQDTHPEGWGKLHQAIGKTHYKRGWPFPYWRKAIKSYEEALKSLKEEVFPEAHLEVLQNLICVHLSLKATKKAAVLLRRGSDLLRRLLNDPKRSDWSKCQLVLRFTGLRQLTVDMYIQSGQLVKALTTAEKDKNACLDWLLGAWSNDIPTPSWVEIQQLLNPSTAFVYWHLSPAALSTFILKHNGSEPILITTPTLTNEEEPPAAVQRLREFENWVKDWNQQYAHYRSEAKDKENHSWRMGMEQRLEKLRNILNISAIEQELKGIKQLILIPHRDLHRFPIHTSKMLYPPSTVSFTSLGMEPTTLVTLKNQN